MRGREGDRGLRLDTGLRIGTYQNRDLGGRRGEWQGRWGLVDDYLIVASSGRTNGILLQGIICCASGLREESMNCRLPLYMQYTVEPLIKDTLNKGHLCIKDTFQCTNL